ncbi:kinesin heavy chain [Reticulomyxa filosa]|uniref:Kinesin heavy chain n=1 Tax=Reticulomyxa filosa TaxID=46433 RepID=X6NBP0_RETFI|nr:kinesin heavy chain [Reticulomyxa filosa]|eukprot:ETO23313.1 kinesin heavy chain [Reticulomyxa filosa]
MFGPESEEKSACEFTDDDITTGIEEIHARSSSQEDPEADDEKIENEENELAETTQENTDTPQGIHKLDDVDLPNEEEAKKSEEKKEPVLVNKKENDGLIPRCLRLLFERLQEDEDVKCFTVQMAFIEVYQEKLRDLIRPRHKLTLRYVGSNSTVDNLSWWDVNTVEQAVELIEKSKKYRMTAATSQNVTSSRSHCIIQCKVEVTLRDGTQQTTKLNFGDLAGSEKITKTHATGQRLSEAKKIVQSLFALKKVIRALSEKKAFIPYQDSALTKLLRDSLGGNSKTTIIVCASPHAYNRPETLATLRFAEMARKIENEAKVNRLLSREEMEKSIQQLQDQLQYLRKQKATSSRFNSTDFRVLHQQLSEMASKAEEFQSKYLQAEIQLLIKTQYIQDLEQTLNERNKRILELEKALENA